VVVPAIAEHGSSNDREHLLDQRRLTDACVSGDEHDSATAGNSLVDAQGKRAPLLAATDEQVLAGDGL
jgi:hypothetical protein